MKDFLREKDIRKQINKRNRNKKIKNYVETKRKIKKEKDDMDYMGVKAKHEQASLELSGGRKPISNKAYRDWNTSAFEYNEKTKSYNLKKSLNAGVDIPKKIKWTIF